MFHIDWQLSIKFAHHYHGFVIDSDTKYEVFAVSVFVYIIRKTSLCLKKMTACVGTFILDTSLHFSAFMVTGWSCLSSFMLYVQKH